MRLEQTLDPILLLETIISLYEIAMPLPVPPPWKISEAKKKLSDDIISGKTEGKTPRQVYDMHPLLYHQYPQSNFTTNFRNLSKAINKSRSLAERDSHAVAQFRQLNSPAPALCLTENPNGRGYPQWQGSTAEQLLKNDMNAGKDRMMTPINLHSERAEYQQFPLSVFRDHIHQERRNRLQRNYWLSRKNNK